MKNTLILLSLSAILFSTTLTQAQTADKSKTAKKKKQIDLGIKAGINFSQYAASPLNLPATLHIGVFSAIHKGKSGLQFEALFNRLYGSPFYSPVDKSIWLGIPVLYEYRILKHLMIQAGPQLTFPLTNPSQDNNPAQQPYLSGVIGLEIRQWSGIILGARYIFGFTDSYSGTYYDALGNNIGKFGDKLNTFQIYLGYNFR